MNRAQKGEAEVSRARCGAGRVRVERDVLSEPEIQETSARHAINDSRLRHPTEPCSLGDLPPCRAGHARVYPV